MPWRGASNEYPTCFHWEIRKIFTTYISPGKHMLWVLIRSALPRVRVRPCQGTSNEYPQHMFSWRSKKKYLPDTYSYLDLWLCLLKKRAISRPVCKNYKLEYSLYLILNRGTPTTMASAKEYISGHKRYKNCFQSKSTSALYDSSVWPTSLVLSRCFALHSTTLFWLSNKVPTPIPVATASPCGIHLPICLTFCALSVWKFLRLLVLQFLMQHLSLRNLVHNLLVEYTGTDCLTAEEKDLDKLEKKWKQENIFVIVCLHL